MFQVLESERRDWGGEENADNPDENRGLASRDRFLRQQLRQIYFAIGTNIFYILNKYNLQFRQIYVAIWRRERSQPRWGPRAWKQGSLIEATWTNIFGNWDKYILHFWQIQFAISTNICCNLEKRTLTTQMRSEGLEAGVASWGNLDKYILQLG